MELSDLVSRGWAISSPVERDAAVTDFLELRRRSSAYLHFILPYLGYTLLRPLFVVGY